MQRQLTRTIYGFFCLTAATALGLDDFNVQMSKAAHEETSWRHDIYSTADSAALWKSESAWFQKPALALRLNVTHEERLFRQFTPSGAGLETSDSDLWSPMFSAGFQTWGGMDVGVAYAHTIHTLKLRLPTPSGLTTSIEEDNELDSIGGYVAKQWDCGFKAAATWSYTWMDGETFLFQEFDTVGASGALGFARSFGEKKFGRNTFVDTSANFLFQSEEETWHFLWLAKAGHNICPRVSVYGIFNLFHRLEDPASFSVPLGPGGYQSDW